MRNIKEILKEMEVIDIFKDSKGYLLVFNDSFYINKENWGYNMVSINKNGWYHCHGHYFPDEDNKHLGKRINVNKIPKDLKKLIIDYYETVYKEVQNV